MPDPVATAIAVPSTEDPYARAEAEGAGHWHRIEDYELGEIARGPWDPGAAHGGAPAALMTRAVEQMAEEGGLRIGSLGFTFLGPVPLGPVELRCRTAKPGRLQRVVEAELIAGGRVALTLSAVLLRRGSLPLPDHLRGEGLTLPDPVQCEEVPSWVGPEHMLAFHNDAIEVRRVEGGPDRVGPSAKAWMHLTVPVVPGEEPSASQRAACAADFGNGLAHPVSFDDYLFANCDLHISFRREPRGIWIGLESTTRLSQGGSGVTTTELQDVGGAFGVATQTLFVERR